MELRDGFDIDRLSGREWRQGKRLVLLRRLYDLHGLARIPLSEIRRLDAANVMLVLGLAVRAGRIGAHRMGRAHVTIKPFLAAQCIRLHAHGR